MQMMSTHKSNQEKTEAWGEAAVRPHSGGDPLERLGEAEVCKDQPRPRWSLGVGKKDEWEDKSSGVTFMWGS